MLVLTRKVGDAITIGDDVKIIVMQVKGKQVRLGIKASPDTVVHREEVYQRIQEENHKACESTPMALQNVDRLVVENGLRSIETSAPLRRKARVQQRSSS